MNTNQTHQQMGSQPPAPPGGYQMSSHQVTDDKGTSDTVDSDGHGNGLAGATNGLAIDSDKAGLAGSAGHA